MFNYLALYKWTLSVLNEFSFPFVLNGLTIHALFNVADIMQDVIAECIHMWHWHNIQWAHVAIIFVFSSSNQLHRNTVNYVVSTYLLHNFILSPSVRVYVWHSRTTTNFAYHPVSYYTLQRTVHDLLTQFVWPTCINNHDNDRL